LVGAKMTLPAEHAEEYLRCKEELLATNIEVWDWMRGLSAVFILLSLGVVFRSLPRLNFLATAINWVTYVCWMLFIVYCSYFGYRLTAVYRRMKAAAGRIHLERPAEAAHWYAGKLIYFNPHDAALFVESLTCPSYTLNFANRRAYLYLALLAGLVWLMF